jgi:predicted transcriptional regulator
MKVRTTMNRPILTNVELQILRTLTKRGRLDRFQIASDANLALTRVDKAIQGLTEQGLLRVSSTEGDRYDVDQKGLGETIRSLSDSDSAAVGRS